MTTGSSILNQQQIDEYISVYRDGLLNDIIPFWMRHSIDREQGGYLTSLDRDGTVVDTDKAVWLHSRFVWMLSALYNSVGRYGVEPDPQWLEIARHGIDFLDAHAFDDDGRVFYLLTREGKPLAKLNNPFSEFYTTSAIAAYAQATGDSALLQRAEDLFRLGLHYLDTPGLLSSMPYAENRSLKNIGLPMMLITTAQDLREAGGDPALCNATIDRAIDEVERHFIHPELNAVLEHVGPNGEFVDSFTGRSLLPGHAIETGWFILDEAAYRNNDAHLRQIGCTMLDWSWEFGWDTEYGGLFMTCDVLGRPSQDASHDLKIWWPHNEAEIAALLAYQLTGEERYAEWHKLVRDWSFRHFADPEYGEWYGALHRDGTPATPLKGHLSKGGFHVPRTYWRCWMFLEDMKK
jgi:N-acylglucosamine 2-epimerase